MKKNKKAFLILLWLTSASFVSSLVFLFSGFFFSEHGIGSDWIVYSIFVASFLPALLSLNEKMKVIFRFLISLLILPAFSVATRFLLIYAFRVPRTALIEMESVLLISIIAFFALWLFLSYCAKRFHFLNRLLREEKEFSDNKTYVSWLSEEQADLGEKKVKSFLSTLSLILIFFLVLFPVLILKNPEARFFGSVLILGYAVIGIFCYLLLFRMQKILSWKFQGLEVPESVFKNWGKVLSTAAVLLSVFSLSIPWYFEVVDSSSLSEWIENRFSNIQINLTEEDDSVIQEETTVTSDGSDVIINEDGSISVVEPDEEVLVGKQSPFATGILYFLLTLIGFGIIYFILAVIGAVLFHQQRFTKRSKVAEFFIRRYLSVRNFVDGVASFFMLFLKFFAAILGFNRSRKHPEDKELSNPVAKQLYSLFGESEDLSDEKKDEIRTIVKDFVRLIDSASRISTPYRHYYGPFEYIEKLSKSFPEIKPVLMGIVEVFNESRYSLHLLTDSKIGNFQKKVDDTVGYFNKQNKQS